MTARQFFLLPFISVLLSQFAKAQTLSKIGLPLKDIKINILFEKQGKIFLNTYNNKFMLKTLEFSNPTHIDTLIYGAINVIKPVHFQYFTVSTNATTKELVYKQTNFILLPGDSIDLEFKKNSNLYLAKYSRFNNFIDSLYNINFDNNSMFKSVKINTISEDRIVELLKVINTDYDITSKKIEKLCINKYINTSYKAVLDDFNLLVKYYKISNIIFDESYDLEKVKYHFQTPVNYIKNNLSLFQSIGSSYYYGLLNLIARYDARLAGRPVENFWQYFDVVQEPLKSNLSYRSYTLTNLESDRTIKTIDQYKQILTKAKQNGIYDARFDSVLINKRKIQNINNLKGQGMFTKAGSPIDYFAMLQSLKGHYVLVDFWASWCGPCRAQMPALRIVKDKLSKENIAFVSVSIDNNNQSDDWLAASRDEKLDRDHHNYRLDKGNKNALLKMYNFSYVPRYMLYDQQGVLISDNFTAPNDKSFESELLKYINIKK